MFSLRNLLLTVAAGLAVSPGLTSAAVAGPMVPDRGFAVSHGAGRDIVPVAFVCNGYSCWNTGPLYNPLNRPYYRAYSWPIYRPYRPYMPPSYRPSYQPYSRSVTIYRPYDGPYYAPAVRSGYGSHVGWCTNRYRTYNPATDRYHAGGGVYRVCVSPYR